MRRLIGIAFLLLQFAMVVQGQFGPTRWYCWAPNDYAIWYRVEVRLDGVQLSSAEVEQRYQMPAEHVAQHPAENIERIIRQRETTYGRNHDAQVTLRYRKNGSAMQVWQWPTQ